MPSIPLSLQTKVQSISRSEVSQNSSDLARHGEAELYFDMKLTECDQARVGRLLAIVHGRAISFRKSGRDICFAHIGRSLYTSSTDV
jgi:hypothetical protein